MREMEKPAGKGERGLTLSNFTQQETHDLYKYFGRLCLDDCFSQVSFKMTILPPPSLFPRSLLAGSPYALASKTLEGHPCQARLASCLCMTEREQGINGLLEVFHPRQACPHWRPRVTKYLWWGGKGLRRRARRDTDGQRLQNDAGSLLSSC